MDSTTLNNIQQQTAQLIPQAGNNSSIEISNSIGYLPNFQQHQSLDHIIEFTKIHIQELRDINLNIQDKHLEEMLCTFLHAINNFELQIDSVINIIAGKPDLVEVTTLGENKLHVTKKEDITEHLLVSFLEAANDTLIKKSIDVLNVISKEGPKNYLLDELHILIPKIEAMVRFFPYVVSLDKSDIFCLNSNDSNLMMLKEIITVKRVGSTEEIRAAYESFLRLYYTGHSMVITSDQYQGYMTKKAMKYLAGMYYILNPSEAKLVTHKFISKPTDCVYDILNMFDKSSVRPLIGLCFPAIEVSEVIQADRLYQPITLQLLDSAIERKAWENPEVQLFENSVEKTPKKSTASQLFSKLFHSDEDKLQIRIVSPEPLYAMGSADKPQFNELIVYIHGGGFVSMTSYSAQMMTRHWAKALGKPIFCLDYKLAPKHKYPAGLDDCWQGYNWIVDHAQNFGVKPAKIILIGDSAGGNLALSLTTLLMKAKRRVPDGLYLPYPAVNLASKGYTPSLLESISDPILSFTYLEMFLNSYIDPSRGLKDPIASPVLIPEALLKQFPPLKMTAGSKDPLHDDILRLAEKLRRAGRNVSMVVYPDMPHGFLMQGFPGGMHHSEICLKEAGLEIKELIKMAQE